MNSSSINNRYQFGLLILHGFINSLLSARRLMEDVTFGGKRAVSTKILPGLQSVILVLILVSYILPFYCCYYYYYYYYDYYYCYYYS